MGLLTEPASSMSFVLHREQAEQLLFIDEWLLLRVASTRAMASLLIMRQRLSAAFAAKVCTSSPCGLNMSVSLFRTSLIFCARCA